MGNAKIEVSMGPVSFSGEGEQEWLAAQLDKVLEAIPRLNTVQASREAEQAGEASRSSGGTPESGTLASYIKSKGAESNQVRRFLATAGWLRRRGSTQLTTKSVSKALKDNHQSKLTNPADCLNQNVSKGFCVKSNGGFYISPEGLTSLNES